VPVSSPQSPDLPAGIRDAVAEADLVDLAFAPTTSFSQTDSALTTDTPTPCRPPETL
jgi:hypothetical protein